jgi:uncharacterized membrane protein YphA (DoxX/SURF4 family)
MRRRAIRAPFSNEKTCSARRSAQAYVCDYVGLMKRWLNDRRDAAVDAIIAYFLPRALLGSVVLAILLVARLETWVVALVGALAMLVALIYATNEKKILQPLL